MSTFRSRTARRPGVRLVLVLALFLVLAVLYSLVVPVGRGADEWAHYWYARFITEHGRLPASPAEREAAGYKSDWPPLYHLLAAGLTAGVDTAGPPAFKYRAENIRRQIVPAQGPEAILHTEDELFPWRQEVLIWRLGRFLSIVFSLGTLVVTYFIGLEIFGDRMVGGEVNHRRRAAGLALAAVAGLAFIPRFLFTGMLFSYDSLTLLLASLFLRQSIRVAKGYDRRWGFWRLGLLAGLALVCKYLAALLPLEILAVILYLRKSGQGRVAWLKLAQAGLAWLLAAGWWFGYLLLYFNEIDRYGPLLGAVAPLLRGDGSDRTVEQIFAWLSGGQAPPPAHIEQVSYTAWQILAELPLTLWGNPITRPYPLAWFAAVMTVLAGVAGLGLLAAWRSRPGVRFWLGLLLLHCALPLPFMLVRLFGARDALEAVQGRHVLFLAGPALVVLLVWGWSEVGRMASQRMANGREAGATQRGSRSGGDPAGQGGQPHGIRVAGGDTMPRAGRLVFAAGAHFIPYAAIGLLLVGALGQLFWMDAAYAPPLPVRTTPYRPGPGARPAPAGLTLPGGARLLAFELAAPDGLSLKVSLFWQGGEKPAPEDYRTELVLVDGQGQARSGWLAYQTEARYPSRAWEAGDVVRDEGWLPLAGLPAGEYDLRLRLLDESGQIFPWQSLAAYTLAETVDWPRANGDTWRVWRQGEITQHPPVVPERATVQLSRAGPGPEPALVGPDGLARSPVSAGFTWANFIIGPDWPAGEYLAGPDQPVALRVAPNSRLFQPPAMTYPLEVNFERQLMLLGYDLPVRRVQPGQGVPVTLYWQGSQWMGENLVMFTRWLNVSAAGEQPQAWGGYDRLTRENYSTLFWAPGEVVVDGFAPPLAPDAPDGIYTLNLGWYRAAAGEAVSLHLVDPDSGQTLDATSVSIGPIKVGGPPPGVTVSNAAPQVVADVAAGSQIKLLGFDMGPDCTGAEAGCSEAGPPPALTAPIRGLKLTLYWQALAAPDRDYTVFVHLRRPGGGIVAQQDGPPAGGTYPTGLWEPGEIIRHEVYLALPEGLLPAGNYELVAGMYDLATGARLPVAGAPDGAILLHSFQVP